MSYRDDPRSDYICDSAAALCGLDDGAVAELRANDALPSFLDDAGSAVLYVRWDGASVTATNTPGCAASPDASSAAAVAEVHFIKSRAGRIGAEDYRSSIIVSSLIPGAAPVASLYHLFRSVYSPLLLDGGSGAEGWSSSLGRQLSDSIAALEQGLGGAVRRADIDAGGSGGDRPARRAGGSGGEDDLSGIATPYDEFQLWSDLARSGAPAGAKRDRALAISECWSDSDDVAARWGQLCGALERAARSPPAEGEEDDDFATRLGFAAEDVSKLLEDTQNACDDVWKLELFDRYPQERMSHLFRVVANAVGQFVEGMFDSALLRKWNTAPLAVVRARLAGARKLCEQWAAATHRLTKVYWLHSASRSGQSSAWAGEPHHDAWLAALVQRLGEMIQLRAMHSELLRLLDGSDDAAAAAVDSCMRAFPEAAAALRCSTVAVDGAWHIGLRKYERRLGEVEGAVIATLRGTLAAAGISGGGGGGGSAAWGGSPIGLLHSLAQWRGLLQRPRVRSALQGEREAVAAQLISYVEQLDGELQRVADSVAGGGRDDARERDGSGLSARNLGPSVAAIVWGVQLTARVHDLREQAQPLLRDVAAWGSLESASAQLLERANELREDEWRSWRERMTDALRDGALAVDGEVVDFDASGLVQVNFSEDLVTLLREVRQLTQLGYAVPPGVCSAAQDAEQYYQYAVVLKKIANFFNSFDSQIIPCQKSMMIDAYKNFEEKLDSGTDGGGRSGGAVSWKSPRECAQYVQTMQTAAEALSSENRALRRVHLALVDDVSSLMGIDMLRQSGAWGQRYAAIRQRFAQLTRQHTPEAVRHFALHWDHQLYKAVEAGYRLGLECLNEQLPEQRCELVFDAKLRILRLNPPLPELRASYYTLIRRFVEIPQTFIGLGVGNDEMFKRMTADPINVQSIVSVYTKAEGLFARLSELRDKLSVWTALGKLSATQLDEFVEAEVTTLSDWDTNFKMIVKRRKQADKLRDVYPIECFSVSTAPLKHAIEEQINVLQDSLVLSLRRSMNANLTEVEEFLTLSMENLRRRAETIEELTQAKKDWQSIKDNRPELQRTSRHATQKKELLSKVAFMSSGSSSSATSGIAGSAAYSAADAAADAGQRLSKLGSEWEELDITLSAFDQMIDVQRQTLREKLTSDLERAQERVGVFVQRWEAGRPKSLPARMMSKSPKKNGAASKDANPGDEVPVNLSSTETTAALMDIRSRLAETWREQLDELTAATEKLTENCRQFEVDAPPWEQLEAVELDISRCEEEWNLLGEYAACVAALAVTDWVTFRTNLHKVDELVETWRANVKTLVEGRAEDGVVTRVPHYINEDLELMRKAVPGLKHCKGDVPFNEDHWAELFRKLGISKGVRIETLTFGHFLEPAVLFAVSTNLRWCRDLTSRATGEVRIREAMVEVKEFVHRAELQLFAHEELGRNTMLITDWKEMFSELGDSQTLLASLKDSPWFEPFEATASVIEKQFADLDNYLHSLNQIQRKWLYLEPIFGRGALPTQQARFRRIDEDFRSVMAKVQQDPRAFSLCDEGLHNSLSDRLETMLDQLERCSKALSDFLEEKRTKMPRFYFIGDEDLLQILGQAANPAVIQQHLKKLFQGLRTVEFNGDASEIVEMCSLHKEHAPLRTPVKVTDEVEIWLDDLSKEMRRTLASMLSDATRGSGSLSGEIRRYPSQVLDIAQAVYFTRAVEASVGDAGRGRGLEQLLVSQRAQLAEYTSLDLGSGDDATLLRLKVKALVLDLIHNIDVVEYLIAERCSAPSDWAWSKQLRYYMRKTSGDGCEVKIVDAPFDYTFEYQGNRSKLVHTPLTDKCYLTLSQGMRLGYGGNPYGPAGTGKTESVKALGAALGRQVLVFNCDEGIDFQSMGRIFIGLVKCGAWGCFDEFNRLKEEQLSAVSQQVQVIQAALKMKTSQIQLLGREVDVDFNAGIFVTMNPAGRGYGGRSKLPDNLKQLFRPIAMTKPDNEQIARVELYAEGFAHGQALANKVVTLFSLSKQLLSKQQHYDWGLRALKTILVTGGRLIQACKRDFEAGNGVEPTAAVERELLVKSVRVNTLSKLTYDDASKFNGLVDDLFPDTVIADIRYESLEEAIAATLEMPQFQLEADASQISKMLQLKESLDQRMGCVIVGPSGTGKSTIWQVLKAALQKTGQKIVSHVMNPKAMPRKQLLGHMNLDTREWSDGVLTAAARQVVREPSTTRSWVICDGDVDPEWIESLNSVLDDSHLLTLPNGERISFGANVNFIFETHDLRFASPATISRMGVIFLSDEDVDVGRVVRKWLRTVSEEKVALLKPLVTDFFERTLEAVLSMNAAVIKTTLIGTVQNGLSQLKGAVSRGDFAVRLVRGLGGNLDLEAREDLAQRVFEWMGESPPDVQRPLDCTWDASSGRLVQLTNRGTRTRSGDEEIDAGAGFIRLGGTIPVVQTISVQRNLLMLEPWLESGEPVVLVGPEGAGKAMLLHHMFGPGSALGKRCQLATLHCNAQTSASHVVQKLRSACALYSSSTGRVFRPRDSERLVLLLKDVNLPSPDKYHTCQLIAFLQQISTYNGFYDEDLEFLGLERVQVIASMNPSTTVGRHALSTRFTATVRIACVGYPQRSELVHLFGQTLASAKLAVLDASSLSSKLAEAMVSVWQSAFDNFTVEKQRHYRFTPRDLTAWVTGLIRYSECAPDDGEGGASKTSSSGGGDRTSTFAELIVYEAHRIFGDRLVTEEEKQMFSGVVQDQIRRVFPSYRTSGDGAVFTALLNESSSSAGHVGEEGEPQKRAARLLTRVSKDEYKSLLKDALEQIKREGSEVDMLLFDEVVENVAKVERILAHDGDPWSAGSLLMVGRSGVGRQATIKLIASALEIPLKTLSITRDFGPRQFKAELKELMEVAGVQGRPILLSLEDFQLASPSVLQSINSLLSGGEVPGLYTHEELEPLLGPLKELLREQGGSYTFRTPYDFFISRVVANLHIAMSMDPTDPAFLMRCESNPALFSKCQVVWFGAWSQRSLTSIPSLVLSDLLGGGEKQRAANDARRRGGGDSKTGDDDDTGEPRRSSNTTVAMSISERDAVISQMVAMHGAVAASSSNGLEAEDVALSGIVGGTPRDFVSFLNAYRQLFTQKLREVQQSKQRYEAGLSKLQTAAETVDTLSTDAREQQITLAEKQKLADEAMTQITEAMVGASHRRKEVTILREEVQGKSVIANESKDEIEVQLKDIRPMLEKAQAEVGNIKASNLKELRALRQPPLVAQHILSGVLILMGTRDTSWASMRALLGRRGVITDILQYDASNITPKLLAQVEEIVGQHSESFRKEAAERASTAVAPLAVWVKANIMFARVLQKVRPLQEQLDEATSILKRSERELNVHETELGKLDDTVAQLKADFSSRTREAEELKLALERTQLTLEKASNLLGKLGGEQTRWAAESDKLQGVVSTLPQRVVLAAGFSTYLGRWPEDVRANYISKWESFATGGGGGSSSSSRGGSGGGSKYDDEYGDDGGDYGDGDGPSGSSSSFRFTHLLSSESELLLWKTEGLPSDELSQQNAIVILHNKQRPPFVIDPSSAASAWLQRRLAAFAAATLERKKGGSSRRNRDAPEQQQSGAGGDFGALEVVPTQHPRFINQVEMALRFGKTLVVTEVDGLEPVLFPIVRRDVVRQGSRLQIFFGDKFVDFHEDFRLFFTTRNPSPSLPPGAEALLTMVNFTVTRSGLEGQLLGAALQHERPELEQQKSELLQQEESFRLQLVKLEDSLLQDLAASEGNLLENVKLIETLTNTKVKAAEIEEALAQASISSRDLDEQREVYRPLASLGSKIFFLVQQLSRINHMYQFSLGAFVGEFRGTLRSTRSNVVDAGEGGDGDAPRGGGVASRLKDLVPALEHRILYFVGRALFKNDRMMWALHLMHGLREDLFQPPLLWRSFVGELVTAEGESSSSSSSSNFPGSDWVQRERRSALARLCQASPQLVNELDLGNERKWSKWANEREPELCFPSIGTSRTGTSALFTRLLLVQALRPDRLPVAVQISVRDELSVTTILPPPLSMARLEEDELSKQAENGGGIAPVLIITGAGADPSKELSELAADKVGAGRYFELAMGGGQEETALKMIREAAMRGNWLCLKNLHLVTAWLPHLEKALNAMTDASKLDPTNAAGGGAEGGGEMRRRGGKRRKEKLVIHRDFRLFLSAEEHGSFNTSLLQQSLKVTYEAPPGIKKNMQRTYDAWEDAFIAKGSSDRAQILFMLAFMNAVILERRTYVPQGWTKFYEFSLADLRAGAGVIDAAIEGAEAAGRRVPWALIHGLFETAVYGGRIANPFDVQVLRTYLQIFLSDEALRAMSATSARDDAGSKEADDAAASVLRSIIPSDLQLPDSREKDDYVAIIDRLPEVDPPAMFGLPANIERSLQRAKAERVVAQLLILSKSADASVGFNRAEWKQSLGPLLRVWESACAMDATLSQLATGGGGASSSSAQRGGDASKTGDGGGSAGREPPLQQFVQLERATAGVLLSLVHTSLTAIGSVIAGTGLLTPLISANASDLMAGRVPDEWLDVWEAGGEEPSRWLDAAIRRAKALSDWEALFRGSESTFLQKLKQTSLDLGELFNPGTFLNSLKQQSSRRLGCSMDSLELECSWSSSSFGSDSIPVQLAGLLLQGATFASGELAQVEAEEAEMAEMPACTIAFVPKAESSTRVAGTLTVPLYVTAAREQILARLKMPSTANKKYIIAGAALILGSS